MSAQYPFDDVKDFMDKFGIPYPERPTLPTAEVMRYRNLFLEEELEELQEAYDEGNLTKLVDSLIDLVYVAYGTAIFAGVSPVAWRECWDAVHDANMAKRRAENSGESKRHSSLDVIKPVGWVNPEETIAEILAYHST